VTTVEIRCSKCRKVLDELDEAGLASAKERGWHDVHRCSKCHPLVGDLKATNRVHTVMSQTRSSFLAPGWINQYGRFYWSVLEERLAKAPDGQSKVVIAMRDPGDLPDDDAPIATD
jgi:hypothetical protein